MKLLQEPETALPECCGENVSCLCRGIGLSPCLDRSRQNSVFFHHAELRPSEMVTRDSPGIEFIKKPELRLCLGQRKRILFHW